MRCVVSCDSSYFHGSYSSSELCCEGPWFTCIQEDRLAMKKLKISQTSIKSAGNRPFRYLADVVWTSLPIADRNYSPLSSIKTNLTLLLMSNTYLSVVWTVWVSVCMVFFFFYVCVGVVVGWGACMLYVLGKYWYCLFIIVLDLIGYTFSLSNSWNALFRIVLMCSCLCKALWAIRLMDIAL